MTVAAHSRGRCGEVIREDLIQRGRFVVKINRRPVTPSGQGTTCNAASKSGGKGCRAQAQSRTTSHHFSCVRHTMDTCSSPTQGPCVRAKEYDLAEARGPRRGQHVANLLASQHEERHRRSSRSKSYEDAPYCARGPQRPGEEGPSSTEFDSKPLPAAIVAVPTGDSDEWSARCCARRGRHAVGIGQGPVDRLAATTRRCGPRAAPPGVQGSGSTPRPAAVA